MDRRASAVGSERDEGDIAGSPNGCPKLALVPGTVARDAAWDDLTPLGDQISQTLDIFIVDIVDLIRTEATDFLPLKAPFGCHRLSPVFVGFIGLIGLIESIQCL